MDHYLILRNQDGPYFAHSQNNDFVILGNELLQNRNEVRDWLQ